MTARNGGWTLADTLVASLFAAFLAIVLHSFALASIDAVRQRAVADDLDETARIALEIIGRDLREAGYGRLARADRGLALAASGELRISRDLDLDGATDSAHERVAYRLDREGRRLLRQLGGAAPQPMVDRVDAGRSMFRYYGENGVEILPRSAVERGQVRRVDVRLHLAAPHPHPRRSDLVRTEHRASFALRNHRLAGARP